MSARPCIRVVLAALALPVALMAGGLELVVVRPGGPNPSEEAQTQVARLMSEIGARAGWDDGSTSALYFNRQDDALTRIAATAPAFLLSTPGFYLAHRKELGLVPINQILIGGKDTHQFHVVVRKGTLESLDDLAGGSLVGSPLAERDFVERIVFEGQLEFATEVDAEYGRALASLRKLSRGEVSAVILDATEFSGLERLPFAESIETIFTSREIPNTGIFFLEGRASPEAIEALGSACRDFCATDEGASICETYGISGFKPAPEGVFDALVEEHGEGPASE